MSEKYRQYSTGGRGQAPWTSSPSSYTRNPNNITDSRYNRSSAYNPTQQQQRYQESTSTSNTIAELDKNRIVQTAGVNKPANAALSVLELKAITAARIAQQQEQARLKKEYNSDAYSTSSDESGRRFDDVKRVPMRNTNVVTGTTKPIPNTLAAPIVNAVVEGGMSIQDLKALTKLRLSSSDSVSTTVDSSINCDRDSRSDYYSHFSDNSDYKFNMNPQPRGIHNSRVNPSAKLDYSSDTSVSSLTSGITSSSDPYDHIIRPTYGSTIPVMNTHRVQLANLINDINIIEPSADFNNIESKLMRNTADIPLSGNSILQPRVMPDHVMGFMPPISSFDSSIAFELAESVLKSPNVSSHGGSVHGGSLHGGSLHGGSLHGGSLHGGSLHGGSLSNSMNGNTIRVGDLNISNHSSDGKRSPRGIRVSK